ncbi:hypothetical protein WJX73_009806 [Symbiochloris irregularis]|uniref:Amidinotransferase n=1 Tax=Symbiochloris irregularis TaxID=706552 RepID=A0AAW1NYL9_9CHLO
MRAATQAVNKALLSSSWQGLRRLASVPEAVGELAPADCLTLGGQAPTIVQLPDRVWGSLPVLPGEVVGRLTGQQPGKVGIGDGSYALRQTATELFRLLKREGVRVAFVPDIVGAEAVGSYNSAHAAASGTGVRQSSNHVLMVAPTAFGFNDQAAQDNHFMHASTGSSEADPGAHTRTVLQEFAGLHHQLTEVAGVNVHLFQHDAMHGTPDAVFPNNWFSTHPRGEAAGGLQQSTLVLYPMKCQNRQKERRADIQSVVAARGYERAIDLTEAEASGLHLEGTGVFVLDRINGVAYVALSERADKGLAEQWVQAMGYRELVTFQATDSAGKPVYHTNVMMAIGTDVAVVCLESVADGKERQHLLSKLSQHHQVVDITRKQMAALCGNVLELEDGRGLPVLALSSQAHNAFTPDQRSQLLKHVAALHHAPIDTLEHIGGGGVRCALAELF